MARAKVLIVDDEPALRRALGLTLTVYGFDVAEARTGEEALLLLDSTVCDAVLLDIDMPGIGGIATCRELRRRHDRLPILMLTVRDRDADRIAALEAGADEFINKPFLFPELLARVRAAVALA
jgi:two-component system KDP operon response regulator KdpE